MPNLPRNIRPKRERKPYKRAEYRAGSSERGYDALWQRLRRWWIKTNPTCARCKERGILTTARDVDHVIPFKGYSDPLRLDATNLQSLCKPCHREKSEEDGTRGKRKGG